MVPMPSVLGDETLGSEGDGAGDGDASLPREGETTGTGLRRPMAGLDEVSEDEAKASSLVASPQGIGFEALDTMPRVLDAQTASRVLCILVGHFPALFFL